LRRLHRPAIAKWAANVGLQQSVNLGSYSLTARISTHYQTASIVGFEMNAAERQGAYAESNASITLTPVDERWSRHRIRKQPSGSPALRHRILQFRHKRLRRFSWASQDLWRPCRREVLTRVARRGSCPLCAKPITRVEPAKHADGKNKVIISCAVTGSVHTPSLSTALPWTPEAIAEQSIAAANAGAAILHLHARDPSAVGRPVTRRCSHVSCGLFMSAPMRLLTSRPAALSICHPRSA